MDLSSVAEKQRLPLQIDEVLEFRSFAKKFLKDLNIASDVLNGDIQYRARLPTAEDLLINSIFMDNSSGKYFQPRGISNYMVATLPNGDIAGLAYVGVKKTDMYLATRNFMIRERGKGIGSIMNAASMDWLQRVSTEFDESFMQVIVNENLEKLEQLELLMEKSPQDPFLKAKFKQKLQEQLRFESIFGKTGNNYTRIQIISPQVDTNSLLETASQIELVKDDSSSLKYIPGRIVTESPDKLAYERQARLNDSLRTLNQFVG